MQTASGEVVSGGGLRWRGVEAGCKAKAVKSSSGRALPNRTLAGDGCPQLHGRGRAHCVHGQPAGHEALHGEAGGRDLMNNPY